MSFLHLIKVRQQKADRLKQAQLLMAKAYRGVPYTRAKHTEAKVCDCTYRGQHYQAHG